MVVFQSSVSGVYRDMLNQFLFVHIDNILDDFVLSLYGDVSPHGFPLISALCTRQPASLQEGSETGLS